MSDHPSPNTSPDRAAPVMVAAETLAQWLAILNDADPLIDAGGGWNVATQRARRFVYAVRLGIQAEMAKGGRSEQTP